MLICACNYRMHLTCSCALSSTCGYASRVHAVSLHTCVPLSSDSSEPPVRHSLLADTEMKPPVWHSQLANTEMKPPERHSLLVDTKMKPPEQHSLLVDMNMKPEEPSETMCGVVNPALLGIIQLGDFTANPLISRFFICQSLPLELCPGFSRIITVKPLGWVWPTANPWSKSPFVLSDRGLKQLPRGFRWAGLHALG